MQKYQSTTELTSEGKTKPIRYGGSGKRAIRDLLDKYVEQFTRNDSGDWMFGGFSAEQLEGVAAELKKRNSKTWRRLKKETKRIYSRSLNNVEQADDLQPLVMGSPEPASGDAPVEGSGVEPKLAGCSGTSCSSPCSGRNVPDGGSTGCCSKVGN